MARKQLNRLFLVLPVLLLSCACDQYRRYESFQDLPSQSWGISDTLSFYVDSLESEAPLVQLIGIRYNDRYEYHNLYIRYLLKDGFSNTLMDSLVNIGLFDSKTGKPLGKGFGNRRTIYDTLPGNRLPIGGSIHLVQYMRKDSLDGIESVGIKINDPTTAP